MYGYQTFTGLTLPDRTPVPRASKEAFQLGDRLKTVKRWWRRNSFGSGTKYFEIYLLQSHVQEVKPTSAINFDYRYIESKLPVSFSPVKQTLEGPKSKSLELNPGENLFVLYEAALRCDAAAGVGPCAAPRRREARNGARTGEIITILSLTHGGFTARIPHPD